MEKRRKKEGKGRKTEEIKSRRRVGDDGKGEKAGIFLSPRLYSFNFPLPRLSKKPLRRREKKECSRYCTNKRLSFFFNEFKLYD